MGFQSRDFAAFISRTSAVRFGEFVLKSGRTSNIFFDFGQIAYAEELVSLGEFFADFIVDRSLHDVDVILGPAYKGISIAVATCIALYKKHSLRIPFTYNRKSAKSHAEKGIFVGYDLSDARSVLVIDDVFTDGGTKYEMIDMLAGFPSLSIKGIVVGIDRQEEGASEGGFPSVFEKKTRIPVFALTTRSEVLEMKDKA